MFISIMTDHNKVAAKIAQRALQHGVKAAIKQLSPKRREYHAQTKAKGPAAPGRGRGDGRAKGASKDRGRGNGRGRGRGRGRQQDSGGTAIVKPVCPSTAFAQQLGVQVAILSPRPSLVRVMPPSNTGSYTPLSTDAKIAAIRAKNEKLEQLHEVQTQRLESSFLLLLANFCCCQ